MAYDLVDWKQAPKLARWWAMDANGTAYWHCQPDVAPATDFWMPEQIEAPHFGYVGDYKESLTEQPTRHASHKRSG